MERGQITADMSNTKDEAISSSPKASVKLLTNKRKRSLSNLDYIQRILLSPQKMIKIGTKEFCIPVNVVTTRSKYFDAMFNRNFEEAKESGVINIEIPNLVAGVEDIVVSYLVTGELPDDLLTETNLFHVIVAFQYLQTSGEAISSVFEMVEQRIRQCSSYCPRSIDVDHKCLRMHEFPGVWDLDELNFERILKFVCFTEGYRLFLLLKWITENADTGLCVLIRDSKLFPTISATGIEKEMIWEIAPVLSKIPQDSEIQKVLFPELFKLARVDSLKLTLLTAMVSDRQDQMQGLIASVVEETNLGGCLELFSSYGSHWIGSPFTSDGFQHMIVNSLTKANRTDVLVSLFDAMGENVETLASVHRQRLRDTLTALDLGGRSHGSVRGSNAAARKLLKGYLGTKSS